MFDRLLKKRRTQGGGGGGGGDATTNNNNNIDVEEQGGAAADANNANASSFVSTMTFGSIVDRNHDTAATTAEGGVEAAEGAAGNGTAEEEYVTQQQKLQQQPPSQLNHQKSMNDNSNNNNKPAEVVVPRLVTRNLPFNQSKNMVQVDHNQGGKIGFLVRYDWFHVLLRRPTYQSVLSLLGIWTAMILIFSGIYMSVDHAHPWKNCGLGAEGKAIRFYGAFAFSLETATTVGYGLPSSSNSFFDNCPGIQAVIYFQMLFSMLFNALMIAFFYSRVTKSESRSVQVLFSNKAIVSVTARQVRLQMRVYDVDAKHPVVEAHVRMYAVKKNRPVPRPLRVLQPDDDLGAVLFLSMPNVIAHHIDLYSILHPPKPTPLNASGLILRQIDSYVGNREGVICPVCGESYNTNQSYIQHVRYQHIVEQQDNYPINGTHLSITDEDLSKSKTASITDLEKLKEYFHDEIAEVIVVVEGIDPLMSGTFQALQSYRFEDIIWNNAASFHPCVSAEHSIVRVDLDRFHDIDIPIAPTGTNRPSLRTHDSFMSDGDTKKDNSLEVPVGGAADDNGDTSPNDHHKVKPLPTSVKLWDAIAEEDGEQSSALLYSDSLSNRDVSQRSSYNPDAEESV